MPLPSNDDILEVLAIIEKNKKNWKDTSLLIPRKDAPLDVRFKFMITQKLLQFKVHKGYSIQEMAQLLGTDKGNLSRILNGKIEKVTIDRLFNYLRICVIASQDKKILKAFNEATEEFIQFKQLKFA
jgi:DNA-binding Xre family transcriptional regulator